MLSSPELSATNGDPRVILNQRGVKKRRMRRLFVHITLLAGAALALAGCGLADVRSPVPEFMRAKAADPVPPEPPPDLKRMLRDNVELVFTAASRPSRVRVSAPRHEPVGTAWTACVQAELNSVIGKPLGTQTYRVTIAGDRIVDRRRAEEEDTCATESYEPI
jgi:hypothetical protein